MAYFFQSADLHVLLIGFCFLDSSARFDIQIISTNSALDSAGTVFGSKGKSVEAGGEEGRKKRVKEG